MKLLLAMMTLPTMAITLMAADASSNVTFVDHDKVAAALAKGGVLITAQDLSVRGSHRTGPGEVEVHEKETDVIYVIEGQATFVTGGAIVGSRTASPGQLLGTDIRNGQSQRLSKGDVIVVPAGTPHWFKEVSQPISYYVVKVIKP
ncbi:MAG TPA: cupin domain-containing protein [Bryobacteraceae bacterium]